RARCAPVLLLLTPTGGIRGLRPHQYTPRVLREGRHRLRAAAVLFLPPPPHIPHASAPTPMPMYTSTLSLPTPAVPPMVWSVSSLPAPVRTLPTSGGKPRSSAREKGRSPMDGLFPFSLSSASSASATQTTTPCPIRGPL
ncbi:hypothetical protein B0H14DRAFT_2903142, partial [Mycena olivaceomarginata]